ncbi:MAG: fused MFS/spermidine synthase [Anaerolineae bacterium]|nr:fused MFS/spermidine synthase [Anaerolineae bacterium]
MNTLVTWRSNRTWLPLLIVFLSSACIMVLELVTGRIIAPYIGMSLYTWTAVIGVVMVGISLGNTLGGRLADRAVRAGASVRLLGIILLLAGLAAAGILFVDRLEPFTQLQGITPETIPLILRLSALAILLCLLPCVALGAVAPIVAKLAVQDLDRTGRTMGRIYAAGAIGSILGTFATGFLLISLLGTHVVVWGVSMLLLLLGALFLLADQDPRWIVLSVVLLVASTVFAFSQGLLDGPCTRESNYFCIQVRQEEHNGSPVQVLILDRLIHSYSSLDDPTRLVYGYEQSYAGLTAYQAARLAARDESLRALFVGGGGYTFPRYMEAVYPDSTLHVIEIDPGVTAMAHELLGLSRNTAVVTFNQDARMFLARQPTASYDLIFGDAFNDYSVPYHLTTREFNDRIDAWLADDGYYVVNIIDGPSGNFLRATIHTLRKSFQYVYPAFSLQTWRTSSRSTIVIIAGDTPLDEQALRAVAPALAADLLSPQEIGALLTEKDKLTLTDRYAPVDQLLLPVFLDRRPVR